MAREFAQGRKINSSHRHAGESGVAKIIKTEGRMDSGFLQGTSVGFSKPTNWLIRVVPRWEKPVGPGFENPTRKDRTGAMGERDRTAGERCLAGRNTQESKLQVDIALCQSKDLTRPHSGFKNDCGHVSQRLGGCSEIKSLPR